MLCNVLHFRLAAGEKIMRGHWSDCAVHNEPESPNGLCNCEGLELSEDGAHAFVPGRVALAWSKALLFSEMHGESLVHGHHFPTDGLVADAPAAHLIDPHTRISGGRDADGVNLDHPRESVVPKFKTDT